MNTLDEIIEGQKRIEAKLNQLITERQTGTEIREREQLLNAPLPTDYVPATSKSYWHFLRYGLAMAK